MEPCVIKEFLGYALRFTQATNSLHQGYTLNMLAIASTTQKLRIPSLLNATSGLPFGNY